MNILIQKIILALILLSAFSFKLFANESITFTLQGSDPFHFCLAATLDKPFTINWGDGSAIETKKGKPSGLFYKHSYSNTNTYTVSIEAQSNECKFTYFDCSGGKQITTLDVSNAPSLIEIHCGNGVLTSLDVSKNTALQTLRCCYNQLENLDISNNIALKELDFSSNQIANIDISKHLNLQTLRCSSNLLTTLDVRLNEVLVELACFNNRIKKIELNSDATYDGYLDCRDNLLPLSELYFLSNRIEKKYYKWFGTQKLDKKYITPGADVDFSSETEFGGIKTVFTVEKDWGLSENDYVLNDGIFKFYNKGDYTITMTNTAIISDPEFPVEVIVEIIVREVGVAETQHASSLQIYPNPVSNILYINLENSPTPPEVKIYSLQGVLVLQTNENQIDVSSLPAGFYVANVNGINRKIIKQ